MFASDVYGLIESCRYFFPVKSDRVVSLSYADLPLNKDFVIDLKSSVGSNVFTITKEHLRSTNITTRDINKRDYEHFLKKEIFETENIILRTTLRYLQSEELASKSNYANAIICGERQVPKFIVDRLID